MKERKITLAESIYPPFIEIERDKRRYSQKRNRKDKLNISIPAAFAKIITYISYIYLIGVIAIIVAGFIYNISTSNVALRLLFFSIGFGFLLFIIYFALPIEEE